MLVTWRWFRTFRGTTADGSSGAFRAGVGKVSAAGTNRLRASLVPLASLVAVAVLLSPVRPFPLLAVPFALFLVAFRPRDVFGLTLSLIHI